jgi:hypothetical protein
MQCTSWGRRLACPFYCGLLALSIAGCSAPNAQLTSCQADKEQLLLTIREQRESNREMHAKVASLEARLDEAEKELARRSPAGTRISTRPVEVEPLPWRSPR